MANGDYHSSFHAFVEMLIKACAKNFIDDTLNIRSDVMFIFCGDLVDRGVYNMEIMYCVFKLKLQNPDNVIIIIGNHENSPNHFTFEIDQ